MHWYGHYGCDHGKSCSDRHLRFGAELMHRCLLPGDNEPDADDHPVDDQCDVYLCGTGEYRRNDRRNGTCCRKSGSDHRCIYEQYQHCPDSNLQCHRNSSCPSGRMCWRGTKRSNHGLPEAADQQPSNRHGMQRLPVFVYHYQ